MSVINVSVEKFNSLDLAASTKIVPYHYCCTSKLVSRCESSCAFPIVLRSYCTPPQVLIIVYSHVVLLTAACARTCVSVCSLAAPRVSQSPLSILTACATHCFR